MQPSHRTMLGPLGSLMVLTAAWLPAPAAAQHPYLPSQPPVDFYPGFNGYFNLAPPPPKRGAVGGAANGHLETLEPDDEVELVAGTQPQQPQRPQQPQPALPPGVVLGVPPGALYGRRVYVLQVVPGGYQHYQPVYVMGAAAAGVGAGASHAAPGYPGVVLLEQAIPRPADAHVQPQYGPQHVPPFAWLRAVGPEGSGRAQDQPQPARQGEQGAQRSAGANDAADTTATLRATRTPERAAATDGDERTKPVP